MRDAILIFLLGFSCLLPVCAQNYTITTVAGGGLPATQRPAADTFLLDVLAVAFNPDATYLYFSAGNCVFRVDRLGMLERVAGTQPPGFTGDGGPATSAQLDGPVELAVDAAENVYVNDTNNHRVRKIAANGIITTYAGDGHIGFAGDGGPATAAEFAYVHGLAVDPAGNLYIAVSSNRQIRKVTPEGNITSLTDGHVFDYPTDIALDTQGDLYVVEDGYTLLKLWHDGHLSLFAGNGIMGYGGDGGLAIHAEMNRPMGLSVDKTGNVYFADFVNRRIRKISTNGFIHTIAGGTRAGYSPDGGLAIQSSLAGPVGTAVDSAGNLVFADSWINVIRMIDAQGLLHTIAGNVLGDPIDERGPATSAQLEGADAVAVDPKGNLYVADYDRAVRVATDGTIATAAGGSIVVPGGSSFAMPMGIAADSEGNLYVSDTAMNRVVKIAAHGEFSVFAGNGDASHSGDGGQATAAEINQPRDLAVDGAGNVYIAEFGCFAIRKVDTNGIIYTVVGNGRGGPGDPPDGVPATSTSVALLGMTVDAPGNIYFADNGKVRKVSAATGLLSTIAGGGNNPGDNLPATSVQLPAPTSLAVDSSGNVYFVDIYDRLVRKVSASTGLITTIAGNGLQGYTGDLGPARSASFNSPFGLAIDGHGVLYVGDYGNMNVRMLVPAESRGVFGLDLTWPGIAPSDRRGRFHRVVTTVSAVIFNAVNSSSATGAVATATVSPGAVLLSMAGDGWKCSDNSCSRRDKLSSGDSYPPIMIEGEVEGQTTVQVAVTSNSAFPASGTVIIDIPDVKVARRGPGF